MLWLSTFSAQSYASAAVTVLHSLSNTEGFKPSTLVEASDGNYYGTTATGGLHTDNSGIGYGTVFRVTPGGTFVSLYSFAGSDGDSPTGVVLGPDGNLYGTTQSGGANNAGTVFKVTLAGALTTIYSFQPNKFGQAVSAGRLTLGHDGNFYGTTGDGGDNACGTIFQVTPAGALTTLYTFPSDTGPIEGADSMVLASDGALYGVTNRQPAVFKITTSGAFSVVHTFTTADGIPSNIALVQGSDGLFYGTTNSGGTHAAGTVFNVSAAGVYSTLYAFSGTSGATSAQPGGLIEGGDGNFYGTIQYGGEAACNCGSIFRITASGTLTNLYYFAGPPDGMSPAGELTRGSDGYFYGSTPFGGTGSGTIYRYDSSVSPPPDISIGVNPTTIVAGQNSTLTWTVANATACTASGGWSGAVALSGNQSVSPTAAGPATFTLTCTSAGGNVTVNAVLNVNPAPPLSISVTPSTIKVGESAMLSWSDTDTNATCTATDAWTGAQPSTGSQKLAPTAAGNLTYNLACTGPAGSFSGSTTLSVSAAPAGKGGGGALGFADFVGLGALAALRRLRRRN
jgi:uncharacterized repeat protein (TIGR03803 family)